MSITKVGDFEVITQPHGVIVRGPDGGELTFSCGERETLVDALNGALRFSDMKLLPPYITFTPFRVKFTASEKCKLLRLPEDASDSLEFTFAQGDDLVTAITEGVDRQVQEQSLSGGPHKMRSGHTVPDPLV